MICWTRSEHLLLGLRLLQVVEPNLKRTWTVLASYAVPSTTGLVISLFTYSQYNSNSVFAYMSIVYLLLSSAPLWVVQLHQKTCFIQIDFTLVHEGFCYSSQQWLTWARNAANYIFPKMQQVWYGKFYAWFNFCELLKIVVFAFLYKPIYALLFFSLLQERNRP